MTHPPLTLKRWHPLNLAVNQLTGPTTVTFDAQPPTTTLLVHLDPRMANQRNLVTLYRAAQVNGLLDSLFEPDVAIEGQPWYDQLPRIVAMDTEAIIDGERMAFTWTDDASWSDERLQEILAGLSGKDIDDISEWTTCELGKNAVAERVIVRILVRTGHETQAHRVRTELRTDFGIGTEYEHWPDEAGIIVTPDCRLDIETLKNLIAEAVFEYSYDEKEDSRETQWYRFMDEAHTVAAKLLLNEHEAAAESIRQAVRAHLCHLLPDDRTVQLRKKEVPGSEVSDVDVVILRDDQAYR